MLKLGFDIKNVVYQKVICVNTSNDFSALQYKIYDKYYEGGLAYVSNVYD